MSIVFPRHTNERGSNITDYPEVVTKPFRIHLAGILWRNTVKAGRRGQRKTEMGYWRMKDGSETESLALVFSLEVFLLMHLTILEESEQKYIYASLSHIWLGRLNILSRLYKRLCGNQAFLSTMLSTDRALRTSLFCKSIVCTYHIPDPCPHTLYTYAFSCCSFPWHAFTEASWVLRIQQWVTPRRMLTMLYFHFEKSWKMLVLFRFVFPHLDGITECSLFLH